MPYLRGENRKRYDGCVFCIKGRESTDPDFDAHEYIVARSEHVYVALNMYPYNNGHLLIIPYAHVPTMEELPPPTLTDLMLTRTRHWPGCAESTARRRSMWARISGPEPGPGFRITFISTSCRAGTATPAI